MILRFMYGRGGRLWKWSNMCIHQGGGDWWEKARKNNLYLVVDLKRKSKSYV